MNNYFLFSAKNTLSGVASAFAPEGTKLAHELISELENINELYFDFELIKLTISKDGIVKSNDLTSLKDIWLDYLPNSLAWALFSEKLKKTFEKNLTGKEGINWLTAKINGNGEQRIYYIPRFNKMLDVLDTEKTKFNKVTGDVIIPHFSLVKVQNYSVFPQPASYGLWKITSGLYISEVLKKAIQKEKLSGVDFEKTRVS